MENTNAGQGIVEAALREAVCQVIYKAFFPDPTCAGATIPSTRRRRASNATATRAKDRTHICVLVGESWRHLKRKRVGPRHLATFGAPNATRTCANDRVLARAFVLDFRRDNTISILA